MYFLRAIHKVVVVVVDTVVLFCLFVLCMSAGRLCILLIVKVTILSWNVYCSKIVLVAIQDEGSKYVSPALDALKRLGARDPILVTFRGSFALAGFAQPDKPYWITQEQHLRRKGPSRIILRIPLKQSRPPGKYIINSCNSGCCTCGTQ